MTTQYTIQGAQSFHGQVKWAPRHGNELEDLLRRSQITDRDKEYTRNKATQILSKCIPPFAEESNSEVGLILGYVQSGKTLSMSAVAATACDNRYRLIILLSGSSKFLQQQTTGRFQKDLDPEGREEAWLILDTDRWGSSDQSALRDELESWREGDEDARTILLVAMKEKAHLERVVEALSSFGPHLLGSSALIIDDEADQASPNTQAARSGMRSTINRRIGEIQNLLPIHTYLGYTATPQALLVLSRSESISPGFPVVLEPGQGYCGGSVFFAEKSSLLGRILPGEVPAAPNDIQRAPESLLRALVDFLIGAAAVVVGGSREKRSMLVHPHQETGVHADYVSIIKDTLANWNALLSGLSSPFEGSFGRMFDEQFQSIEATVGGSMPGRAEVAELLKKALRRSGVVELNSEGGQNNSVKVRHQFPIYVGAGKLDRGVTIPELTVTYMPRGTGIGNSDSIQQRARFFGYRSSPGGWSYLGYCRVYITHAVENFYRDYLRLEEDIRSQLLIAEGEGTSLGELRRQFINSPGMRLTRGNVFGIAFQQMRWTNFRHWTDLPSGNGSDSQVDKNNRAVELFCEDLGLNESTPDRELRIVDAATAMSLLGDVEPYGVEDRSFHTLLQAKLRDSNTDKWAIYFMNGDARNGRSHRRTPKDGRITLFSGRRGQDGDGIFFDENRVTLHVRFIRTSEEGSRALMLSVRLPRRLGEDRHVEIEAS